MPRARSISQDQRQTAAASENGGGCFSVYVMPPLAALFIACMLAVFALRAPLHTSALTDIMPVSPALTPMPQSGDLSLPVVTPVLPVADNTNLVVPSSGVDSNAANPAPQTSNNPLFEFTVGGSAPVSVPGISPIFTKEVQYWAKDIVRWANEASLDPNLVAVVMQIESCGDPRAISRSGAIGLFQVMPFHFHLTDNPFDPDTNALRGLNYLSRSLAAAGGNPRLALAGYNGGIGVISRGEWDWPSETKRYVQIGGPLYEDAHSGATASPTMELWYGRGTSLCRQASNRLGINE
ncbi:MAG: lytic transglycosylase domain-containing protein [Byssovorax cruenta]